VNCILSIRIQARAIRRCGELLLEFEKQHGANQNIRDGNGPKVYTRKEAAEDAGLSERQQKTAVRVASVPEEEFEAQVESDSPPTVTALAEQGTHKKPLHDLEGPIRRRPYRTTEHQGHGGGPYLTLRG
jgi:hypothetical protein